MGRAPRLLVAALVLGLLAKLSGSLTYAAFASPTAASGSFAAGTVALGDNDAGVAALALTSATPGASDTACILVIYSGSLDAAVRLYGGVSGALAPYLTLTVTRGTETSSAFDSCASFSADATDYIGAGPGVVYSGPLSAYPATYAAGVVDPPPGGAETWTMGEAHSYRLAISLNNDDAARGLSATATFTWEARNL